MKFDDFIGDEIILAATRSLSSTCGLCNEAPNISWSPCPLSASSPMASVSTLDGKRMEQSIKYEPLDLEWPVVDN